MLEDDADFFLHQSLSTPCLNALSASDGAYLVDVEGRRILDFHGNSAHQVGYGHPRVIAAIKQQLDCLPFCPRRYTNQPAIDLANRLAALAPGWLSKVLFAPSGTAAVGMAMKLARYATGRHKTVSMWDSFHGASLDAISIGGEALFRDDLGPLLPDCLHVPWPSRGENIDKDIDAIERIFAEHDDIGAVIAEPLRSTTVHRPPDAYWRRVRELCDRHGALLVFDEIPLALGRTGRMFCCEHAGVVPDVLVIGKGLGGGVFPLAGIIARDDLDVASHRALGHYTHEKSPVGCAAALATLDVIEAENLLEQASKLGAYALDRLHAMQEMCDLIGEVRGLGLALAVELRRNDQRASAEAEQVMYSCLSRGLSFKVSAGSVLTLTPPLTISQAQLDEAFEILEQSIVAAAQADPASIHSIRS
jgi:4-aminobutyrate aminotransferase